MSNSVSNSKTRMSFSKSLIIAMVLINLVPFSALATVKKGKKAKPTASPITKEYMDKALLELRAYDDQKSEETLAKVQLALDKAE
ncbi:hypothetical protein WDW86_18280, partial [Bdellovibrionota bacterium FG-2]